MTAAQRSAIAANMQARFTASVASRDAAAFAREQQASMRTTGVRDLDQADQLAQLSSRSDPLAVASYVAEVLALDLRAQLPAITAPILVLAPYFDQDPVDARTSAGAKATYDRTLLTGAARVQVRAVPESRHFLMFDQPQVLNDLLRTYLQSL